MLQSNWFWCRKCQGLHYGNLPRGACPAGGPHDDIGSGRYSLTHGGGPGQQGWRWCRKCMGLHFAPHGGGRCPAGGSHVTDGSGEYTVPFDGPGQSGWRWCRKCQGLAFGGSLGRCPAGDGHDYSGSGNYVVTIAGEPRTVRTGFVPARHGFHFTNGFVNPIIGELKTRGRCNGMAYAALDCYLAGVTVPPDRDVPHDGTPWAEFISRRNAAALVNHIPGYVGRLLPHQTDHERFTWGVGEEHEWGKLMRWIDYGRPVPLPLISVKSGLDVHHCALAIGYVSSPDLRQRKIFLYEPNYPDHNIALVPDPSGNCFAVEDDGRALQDRWRTYFVDEAYGPVRPLS